MGLVVWLTDALVLYGFFLTAPLLGLGCLIYYLVTLGVAFNMKPKKHKGMGQRLKMLERQQRENNRIYSEKEIDKARDKWDTWANKEGVLPPSKVIIIFVLLFAIGWGLRYV